MVPHLDHHRHQPFASSSGGLQQRHVRDALAAQHHFRVAREKPCCRLKEGLFGLCARPTELQLNGCQRPAQGVPAAGLKCVEVQDTFVKMTRYIPPLLRHAAHGHQRHHGRLLI